MAKFKKRLSILKKEAQQGMHEKDRLPPFVDADFVPQTKNYQLFMDGVMILIPKDIFERCYIPRMGG